MHNPLGTLKNMKPMKTIMYFIIFCCIAVCSSVAGGMNIFCCQIISPTVNQRQDIQVRAQRQKAAYAVMNGGITPVQFHSMSGAARLEHQRIARPEQRRLPQLDVDHQAPDTAP